MCDSRSKGRRRLVIMTYALVHPNTTIGKAPSNLDSGATEYKQCKQTEMSELGSSFLAPANMGSVPGFRGVIAAEVVDQCRKSLSG